MAEIKQIVIGSTKYDIHSIEYITGTQTSSTYQWKGATYSAVLDTGKVIAYKLPYAGTTTAAVLDLTLSGGTTTGNKNIKINGTESVTNQFPANSVLLMIYDGTNWQVLGGSQIELATTSENFVQEITPTTANISVSNNTLNIGATTILTGLTTTLGSAITAVENDANIANAYGVYF